MPSFRNRNSGQVVTHDDPALVDLFRRWARWEDIGNAPAQAAPEASNTLPLALPSTGANKSTWVTFAKDNGVTVTSDMNKDDVIAAVKAAFAG